MIKTKLAIISLLFLFWNLSLYFFFWEYDEIRTYGYYGVAACAAVFFWTNRYDIRSLIFSFPVIFVLVAQLSLNMEYDTDIPFVSGLSSITLEKSAMLVYLVGLAFLFVGWQIGALFSRWIQPLPRISVFGLKVTNLLWAIYFISLSFNYVALVQVGGVPLFDIALRWSLDPKLVFFAGVQIYVIPFLLYFSMNSKSYAIMSYLIIIISMFSLALLGARNPLFKLLVVVAVFNVVNGVWNIQSLIKVGLTLGLLGYLIVGIYTKTTIYDVELSWRVVLAILSMDSLGTLYNFSQIVEKTPVSGYFHGQLIYESVLKMFPGFSDARYANQYIGMYLGYGDTKSIGDTVVEAQISLSPTMFGVAYADFGILGVIVTSMAISGLLGFLYMLSKLRGILSAYFSVLAMIVIYSTYGGFYAADLLYGIFFCFGGVWLYLIAGITYRGRV